MSENLNINVLVAAKEEYTKQLVYCLSPEIYTVILNVYRDSQKLKKKMSISLRNFQLELKRIPTWNTIIIEKHTKDIKTKIPYLLNLITAIFVSHVKILACVRLKADSRNINVKVPDLDHFLHQIIIMNAEKIYYTPDIIQRKKEYVIMIISETIEETIRNQIPIDKILTEYLAGVFEDDDNNKVISDKELKNLKSEIDEDTDSEIDNELEELENCNEVDDGDNGDSDNGDSDEELPEQKSIVPSRPLPQMQFGNEINENSSQVPNNESGFPVSEIKNRVLFSDAMEKKSTGKGKMSTMGKMDTMGKIGTMDTKDKEDNDESDSDSDLDLDLDSDDNV